MTILFVISIVAVATYYSSKKRRDLLSLEQSYVIGTVKDESQPARGGPMIKFTYSIYEMSYTREVYAGRYGVKIGEKYFGIQMPKGLFANLFGG